MLGIFRGLSCPATLLTLAGAMTYIRSFSSEVTGPGSMNGSTS